MTELKELLNNETENADIILDDNYWLYVERLECVDGEEDILIELFSKKENNDMVCNGNEYIPHFFKSNSNVEDIKEYGFKLIKKIEK